MSELRHAWRAVVARPTTSLVIIFTLALGLGAATAIYSAIQSLVLRPPPFATPDRLVRVTSRLGDVGDGPVSVPEFDEIRALPVFASAALYTDQGMYNASGFGTPEELPATITTHDLFTVLGVAPALGGTFPPVYDRTRNFGLVISHGLWVRKYAQSPDVLGRTMTLDGADGYTIHGVMPPGFVFPSAADLYRSNGIAADPAYYARRDVRDRYVVARLRDGVTLPQARAALDVLAARLASEHPATNRGLRFDSVPLTDLYTAPMRPFTPVLAVAVGLVLLVVSMNVGTVLLSRAIDRHREFATRAALGATRRRIARLLVMESGVLALCGSVMAVLVAMASVRGIAGLTPVEVPPWMRIVIDWRVGLFLTGIALITGLTASLLPAMHAASPHLQDALKEGARGSSEGHGSRRLRDWLVVGEVAVALALLVGAGLLLQTLTRLQRVDPGIDIRRALTFRVELGWAAYGTRERITAFHDEMLRRLRALPGVQGVTFDTNLALSGKPRDPRALRLPGQGQDEEGRNPYVHVHAVGPDFFAVSGVRIEAGRTFDTRDDERGAPVVIVSAPLAARLWPGRDPLGERLQFQDTRSADRWATVVGVAAGTVHHELDAAPGFDIYEPYRQVSATGPYYLVRTAGDPGALASKAPAIVGTVDPNQSYLDVQTYERRVSNRLWQRRLAATLFSGFALLTLVLAFVGLYGVLTAMVARQTREIGVRVALGARPADVASLVGYRGLTLVAIGVGVGAVGAALIGRFVQPLLFGVGVFDPWTFLLASGALLGTAAVAAYVPTRRALAITPAEALRAD